jgi:hypothetical protein
MCPLAGTSLYSCPPLFPTTAEAARGSRWCPEAPLSATRDPNESNPRSPGAQARFDRALEQARGALDDAAQSAAWAAGQAMTLEQAVMEALEERASGAVAHGK